MKNNTGKQNDKQHLKPQTPIMPENEMERFITVLSRNQDIQDDYLFNGFLFFFDSIYQTIKENPITAQNLMHHLKQHVFNNLMWESYHAFTAQVQKAPLIFSSSQPYIYEDETEEKENKSETEETPQTEQPKAKTLEEHHLQIMANKLSHILESDKVSDDAKEALQSIICEMSNEANIGIDSPELIGFSFPLLVGSLHPMYGSGFVSAIRALLDSGLVSEIDGELIQYQKQFDGRTEDELKVLDLSNSPIEVLAVTLSGLMHNPNLPEPIKGCLEENLNVIYDTKSTIYSPENILGNLKEKLEAKNDE